MSGSPATLRGKRAETLQPSIAYQRGHQPSPYYRVLFLNAAKDATPAAVHDGLAAVNEMLHRLAAGEVRELAAQPTDMADASTELFSGLEHLMGFGRRMFDSQAHDPPLTHAARPAHLAYLPPDGPFPSLTWERGANQRNRGEADIALQFTAQRQAAVDCAAVEVWKLLEDRDIPLMPAASFAGFGRHDGRGWLEFHDGVSNMHSSQRRVALEAPADPAWMAGGTYMAFLRLAVDLAAWRALPRSQQELLVGRDKLTGAALVGTRRDESGAAVPQRTSPRADGTDERRRSDFLDPPETTDPVIEASHVHRANQLRASPAAGASLRIFRQGYEFLDDISGRPRLGLNFVSFQRDLAIINHLLHLPGWLGGVNFGGRVQGGRGEPEPVEMLAVAAGGFYAVPPRGDAFPGAGIFRMAPGSHPARTGRVG